MIIGLDLDHTISDVPELFAVLSVALIVQGHEVHVITFREPTEDDATRQELSSLGIACTSVHLPGPDDHDPPTWKARVAEELGLDAMFEDSPEVLAAMPTGVRRFWLADPEVFNLDVCVGALRKAMQT